jgi:hypothetical protein
MLPFDTIHKSKNGYGIFEAYKNKSIKVVFYDRTVLRINFGQDFANILTKTGESVKVKLDRPIEFEFYVTLGMEYFENVFTDANTKLQRLNHSIMVSEMVAQEIEKNQRFLRLTNKNFEGERTSVLEDQSQLNETGNNSYMHNSMIQNNVSYQNQSTYQHQSTILNTSSNFNNTSMKTNDYGSYFDIDDVNQKIREYFPIRID